MLTCAIKLKINILYGIIFNMKNKEQELWDIYDIHKQKTGKTIYRGQRMNDDEYHLFVQVWLINKEGLFLCQQRSKNMKWPLMWCANGGNAKAGEDGYSCARREILEELKIDIKELKGYQFNTCIYQEDNQNYFCDSFVYYLDKDIKDIDYQKEEIEKLEYMDIHKIKDLMTTKDFFTYEEDYLDELEHISLNVKNNSFKLFNKGI